LAASVADTQALGGNLRLVFPGADILVPGVIRHVAPAEGALWVVYEDRDCEGRPLTEQVSGQGLLPLPGVPCALHEGRRCGTARHAAPLAPAGASGALSARTRQAQPAATVPGPQAAAPH
jgi:hypothetical protein